MSGTLKNPRCLALVLVAFLGGCADTSAAYTALNAPPRPAQARPADQVQLFTSAPPGRPHVDVGLITVEEGDGDETPVALIGLMRQIAAENGCDALVVGPASSKTGEPWLLGVTRSRQVFSGTCVVYAIAEPRNVAPTAPANRRRMCRDRRDFDESRNCILGGPVR